MPDARKLAAIAGRGKKAGAVTTIGKSPATQALVPSLSAPIKSGKGGVENQVTIAQIRQMAFSPDPADRQLLREMVAGMSPMQQNNLYLRMNAEMRDARAGVNAKGNPVAELSPEGELLEQIIWDGVDPPPEKLAAIRAIQEAGDVGGLGDVDLSNVEDLQPKGAPARPKVNAPDGVTLTEPGHDPRFTVRQKVSAGPDGSVQIKNTDVQVPRQDQAAIEKGKRYEQRVAEGKRAKKPDPVGNPRKSRSAADVTEAVPVEDYAQRLLRVGGIVDPRGVKGDAAFRNFDMDGAPDRAVNSAPGGGSALPATRGATGGANAAARTSAGDIGDLDSLMQIRGIDNPNSFSSPEELARALVAGMPQDAFTAIPLTQADRARALDAIGSQGDVLNADDLPAEIRLTPDQQRGVAYNAVGEQAPDVLARGSLDGGDVNGEQVVGRRTVQQQFIDGLARKLDELYGSYGWGDQFRGPQLVADPDGNWMPMNRNADAAAMEAAPAGGLGDIGEPVIADLPGKVSPPSLNPRRVPGENAPQPFNPQAADIYKTDIDPDFPEDGPRDFLDPQKVARRDAKAKASDGVKGAGPAGDLTGSNKKISEGRASKRNPVIEMLEEQQGRKFTTRRTVDVRRQLAEENLPKGDPRRVELERELRDALLIDDYLDAPDRMAAKKGGKRRGSKAPKADNPAAVQDQALDNAATDLGNGQAADNTLELNGQPSDVVDAEFELKPNPQPPGPVVNDIGTNWQTVSGRRPPDPVEPATTTDMIPVGPAYDPNVHTNWVPGDPTPSPNNSLIVRPPDAPTPNAPGTPSTSRIRSVLNSVGDYGAGAARLAKKHPIKSAIGGVGLAVGLSAFLNSGGNSPDGYNVPGGGGSGDMAAEEMARLQAFENTFGPSIHAENTPEGRIRAALRARGGNGSGLNAKTQTLQHWNR